MPGQFDCEKCNKIGPAEWKFLVRLLLEDESTKNSAPLEVLVHSFGVRLIQTFFIVVSAHGISASSFASLSKKVPCLIWTHPPRTSSPIWWMHSSFEYESTILRVFSPFDGARRWKRCGVSRTFASLRTRSRMTLRAHGAPTKSATRPLLFNETRVKQNMSNEGKNCISYHPVNVFKTASNF